MGLREIRKSRTQIFAEHTDKNEKPAKPDHEDKDEDDDRDEDKDDDKDDKKEDDGGCGSGDRRYAGRE